MPAFTTSADKFDINEVKAPFFVTFYKLCPIVHSKSLQILRRRYIDTMERARIRANQRKRSQIEQNSNFLQNVG